MLLALQQGLRDFAAAFGSMLPLSLVATKQPAERGSRGPHLLSLVYPAGLGKDNSPLRQTVYCGHDAAGCCDGLCDGLLIEEREETGWMALAALASRACVHFQLRMKLILWSSQR